MKFYATLPVDGAFCRYVTIDAEMAHPVSDSMSDEAAALLEPLSVAIATMRKAHVHRVHRCSSRGRGRSG
jgi:L-iditol 2-dehydrogenase